VPFSLPAPETIVVAALGVVTIIALLVAFVAAGVGVFFATYWPVKTFGGPEDYTALAVAAVATGVVASFTAILGPWTDG
jgi:hypothetical protein